MNMAEEDNEIVESWEDLEDNVMLDKKLTEMKPKKKDRGDASSNFTLPARPTEDSSRTPFTPQVKILKREPNAGINNSLSRSAQPKPTKTLEQREAEYAEARLRILGQDYVSNNPNQNNTPADSVKSADLQERLATKFEGIKVTDNVVRQPRGPDGSRGFQQTGHLPR